MANPRFRGPRALSDILGELFTVRGYGRLRALSELEEAWNKAVGEPHCHETRVGEVRRGVLNVTVAHPTLLEELAAFRKPALLQALRAGSPGTTIHDIRFRIGPIDEPEASPPGPAARVRPPSGTSGPSKPTPGASGKQRHPRGQGKNQGRTAGDD